MPGINLSNNFNLGEDLTDRQLKTGYWFVTHRLALEKWLKIILAVLALAVWAFVVWQVVLIIINYNSTTIGLRRIVFNQGIDYSQYLTSLAPQPLQVSAVKVLASSTGRADVAAAVRNPNHYWLAVFNYRFSGLADEGYQRQGFVLPGEEKYLFDSDSVNNAADLEITDLRWEKIMDFDRLKEERFMLAIKQEQFTRSNSDADPSILSFEITNQSAFSYWQVEIQTFLNSGGNLVSINSVVLEKLKAGETRKVDLYWYNRLPQITGVEIVPTVNFLADQNIIPPEGEVGEYR